MERFFCFDIFDLKTGEILGGIKYDPGTFTDSEAAFIAAHKEFSRHYPDRELHVEQITYEDYQTALGR